MMNVTISLYGRFRQFSDKISIQVPEGSTANDVKTHLERSLLDLAQKLGRNTSDAALVFDSALASDEAILSDDSVVDGESPLSILPPVCGG